MAQEERYVPKNSNQIREKNFTFAVGNGGVHQWEANLKVCLKLIRFKRKSDMYFDLSERGDRKRQRTKFRTDKSFRAVARYVLLVALSLIIRNKTTTFAQTWGKRNF